MSGSHPTVRDAAHRLLEKHGMTTIFGNPGSNELPFLSGLPASFRYVLGLHEGAVVGMADGYTQATGRPALVNLHAASGSGNAMGALTNAVSSRTPLVVVAGQQVRPAIGPEANLANVDASSLMRPLVGWAAEPACAGDVPRSMAQAIFEAHLQRRPTYLSVPYDDWDQPADANAQAVVRRQVQHGQILSVDQAGALVDRVRTALRPALVLGGDMDSPEIFDATVTLAELLNCPVWAAPSLFRLPFPNRHPQFRGVLPAGIRPVADALSGHDLVVVLGAPVFRYHEHQPGDYLPEVTALVQVTSDASAAARAPVGEALVADPAAAVRLLVTELTEQEGPKPVGYAPITPPRVGERGLTHPEEAFASLRDTQAPDTAYVVESTSTNSSWWRQMDLRRPGSYYFPAAGGLGFGLPAAVGVALGQPDRPVVGVIGDGSANYGITALWTAAQERIPVTFVLLRNGTYGALRWFSEVLGTPDVPGLDVPGLDFTQIAAGYGVPARHCANADELRAALAEPADGPRLLQIDTLPTLPNA